MSRQSRGNSNHYVIPAVAGSAVLLSQSSRIRETFVPVVGSEKDQLVQPKVYQLNGLPVESIPVRTAASSRNATLSSSTCLLAAGALGASAVLPFFKLRSRSRKQFQLQRKTQFSKGSAIVCYGLPPPAEALALNDNGRQLQMIAVVAASLGALAIAADPAAAQEAIGSAVNVVAEAVSNADDAEDAVEATTGGGDWFDPVVTLNASLIALIDNVLEGNLKIPSSFGFSIIIYTAFIKLVTYPLTSSSLKSNAMMQLLQPKIRQIQTRYAKDQETQNRMLLRLYDDCGVNPLGGCLPSLIPLPIYIGLYRSINKLAAADPRFQESFLWIPSLAGPGEPGKLNLDWLVKSQYPDHFEPLIGWHDAGLYLILPVVLVVSQFLTQSASQPQGGGQGGPAAALLGVFPLIIGYTSLVSPAGLGVYWLCNNLFTQAQSAFIKKQLGDEFPEYKKLLDGTAAKEAAAKAEAAKEAAKQLEEKAPGRGFALSSIDDDDEDEAPVALTEVKEEEVVSASKVDSKPKMSESQAKREAKKLANQRRRR